MKNQVFPRSSDSATTTASSVSFGWGVVVSPVVGASVGPEKYDREHTQKDTTTGA